MGLIAVEGMRFYANHGYYKEEQVLGGQYTVDVYLRVDFAEAAKSDDLDFTVNYEQVYAIVKGEMETRSKLIEHVGKRILDSIKTDIPYLTNVKVRISKLNPPLNGDLTRVYVELEESVA